MVVVAATYKDLTVAVRPSLDKSAFNQRPLSVQEVAVAHRHREELARRVPKREAIYREVPQRVLAILQAVVEDIMAVAAATEMEPLALVQEMDPVAAAPLTSIWAISETTWGLTDRVGQPAVYSLVGPRRLIMLPAMVSVAV
jgi:hypothetical protein